MNKIRASIPVRAIERNDVRGDIQRDSVPSPVSAGARVGDPQRVASRTDDGTNFRVTRQSKRWGSQGRAPEQCGAVVRKKAARLASVVPGCLGWR